MYNANGILKTYYVNAIKAVLPGLVVRKNYVENQAANTNSYVLVSSVQNTDAGSKNIDMYKAFITIGIYTRAVSENDGLTVDTIADAIFSLYPTPQSFPVIDGYNVITWSKESDNEVTVSLDSGNTYINRVITFSHILQQLN